MTTDTLVASVQYNDWKGTAAADNADQRALADLLEEKKLLDRDTEFLVAAQIWIGENHGGKVQAPMISAFVIEHANTFDDIDAWLRDQADPIPVRRIDVELTTDEFIGLFKRFSVVLTRKGLGLDGREYQHDDE